MHGFSPLQENIPRLRLSLAYYNGHTLLDDPGLLAGNRLQGRPQELHMVMPYIGYD